MHIRHAAFVVLLHVAAHAENPHISGWCSPKKANAMKELIAEVKPSVCVELGVFAGASLFPTAMALKEQDHGVVYGIDAWENAESVKYYETDSPHRVWWMQQDMYAQYESCQNLIATHGLQDHAILMKETFANALPKIGVIDILHIDATHTSEGDFVDATPYCDKVRLGGFVWFDGWANSARLYEYLKKDFRIEKVINGGQCILLKRTSET